MNLENCSLLYFNGPQVVNNYIDAKARGLTLEDVMNIALTFDFNKYKKEGDQTFESKFMERTTNELGNIIKPAAAEVIILQFRKFMAVMAFNMMYEKELGGDKDIDVSFKMLGNVCYIH